MTNLTYANVMSTIAVFGVLAGGGAYAASKIGSSDIAENAIRGKHIKADTVGAADVNEARLGQVPAALIGGMGRRSAGPGNCDPSGPTYVNCALVTLDLTRDARVLLIGHVIGRDQEGYGGDCRLGSTNGVFEETTTSIQQPANQADRISLFTISEPLPPGEYSFGVDCNQNPDTDALTSYEGAAIAAVAISPD